MEHCRGRHGSQPTAPAPAQPGASEETAARERWGSIESVVNAPLLNVSPDAWWISVVLCWLLLPLNLLQGVLAGTIGGVLVLFAVGGGCCGLGGWCSVYGTVMAGRPLHLAFNMWRYMIGTLVALIRNGRSRLGLFLWERDAFGQSRYFWHGEGIWCWSHRDCDAILRGPQRRAQAFGCVRCCCPDLFAERLILFLSNDASEEGAEWRAIRQVMHCHFLEHSGATYKGRLEQLPGRLREAWPGPTLQDYDDLARVRAAVARCIFFMMFGVWLEDAEAATLAKWRAYASLFILPRLAQRLLFNIGIGRVKQLRVDTVGIVEKYGLQSVFLAMNEELPQRFRRARAVQLCDEMMYAVGFAGVGGTSACVESVGAFLQLKKPAESFGIDFGAYKSSEEMLAAYLADPVAYIKETCRLDSPVTSATAALHEEQVVELGGGKLHMPAGSLNQYALSVANRDPAVFVDPGVFRPGRANLSQALTWNGAFGVPNEEQLYPRICPARYLALDIARCVVDHVVSASYDGTAPAA